MVCITKWCYLNGFILSLMDVVNRACSKDMMIEIFQFVCGFITKFCCNLFFALYIIIDFLHPKIV